MRQRRRVQEGQTLVIVALCVVVLLSFVALGVDGGSALLQRRTMQNSADAGALAASQLMEINLAVTCNPGPCHPSYVGLTNQNLSDRIYQLVSANRGGALDAASYPSPEVEYHFMAGAPDCAPAASPCYLPASGYDSTWAPPAWVDGVRVTASVNNPTTFARALNIQSIPVGAVAAARLFPAHPLDMAQGAALPMTRFRPALEAQLAQGNDRCHPVEIWNSQGDIPSNPIINDVISFNTGSFNEIGQRQWINSFDTRHDLPTMPNYPPGGGPCSGATCADMQGLQPPSFSNVQQDVSNWLYWQWAGTILTSNFVTETWPIDSETWYPANRSNDGGKQGNTTARPGDWAETYHGDLGASIDQPFHDLAATWGFTTTETTALGWGMAIDEAFAVFGPPALPDGASDDTTTQQWVSDVPIPGCVPGPGKPCPTYTGWEDVKVSNAGGTYAASGRIDRVRFTKIYPVRLYADLKGGSKPPECASWPDLGAPSTAYGFLMDTVVPGPGGGNGGDTWSVGGSVYGRAVDPGNP